MRLLRRAWCSLFGHKPRRFYWQECRNCSKKLPGYCAHSWRHEWQERKTGTHTTAMTNLWLRGARYYPWTKRRENAAAHDTPGIFSMLLYKYEKDEPEILRITTTVLVERHEPRPGEG